MNSLKIVSNPTEKNSPKEITYKGKQVSCEIINDFIKYWSAIKECNLSGITLHPGLEYSDFEYWHRLMKADKEFKKIYGSKIRKELIKLIFNGLPYKIALIS